MSLDAVSVWSVTKSRSAPHRPWIPSFEGMTVEVNRDEKDEVMDVSGWGMVV